MADIPNSLKFLESHEWAREEDDGSVTVGISDHAQSLLGDIVFVELPEVGSEVNKQDDVAVVESVKAASDVYTPLSGEVLEVNEMLTDRPEVINTSPYGDGWFFKIKVTNKSEIDTLMNKSDYEKYATENPN